MARLQLLLAFGSVGLAAAGLGDFFGALTHRIVPKAVFQGACYDDETWASPDGQGYTCKDWADERYGPDPCRTHYSGQGYMSELFKACPLTCKLCAPEAPPVPRRLVRCLASAPAPRAPPAPPPPHPTTTNLTRSPQTTRARPGEGCQSCVKIAIHCC
jgi:hypothetical protein